MIKKINIAMLALLLLLAPTVIAQTPTPSSSIAPPTESGAPTQETLNQINAAAERTVTNTATEEDAALLEEYNVKIIHNPAEENTPQEKSAPNRQIIWILIIAGINLLVALFLLFAYFKVLKSIAPLKKGSKS